MDALECLSPDDWPEPTAPAWSRARWRLLAQGDSWFAPGPGGPGGASGQVLASVVLPSPSVAVEVSARAPAAPRRSGSVLAEALFQRWLSDPQAPRWDAIVLSLGGDDLVEATSIPAQDAQGQPIPLHLRLLRHPTEWGKPSQGVARYFSQPGWETLAQYLRSQIAFLLQLRDAGPSAGRPVFLNGYAAPVPRVIDAGDAVLAAAFAACAVPTADWPALARLLYSQLCQLFVACAADAATYPHLHVLDAGNVPLAAPHSGGSHGDWADEIHLNHSGASKIGQAWGAQLVAVLDPPPPVATKGRRR